MVALQHTELEVLVRILEIPNPRTAVSTLLDGLLLGISTMSDIVGALPYSKEVLASTLKTHFLDGDGPLVLRAAYRQVICVTAQCS